MISLDKRSINEEDLEQVIGGVNYQQTNGPANRNKSRLYSNMEESDKDQNNTDKNRPRRFGTIA